MGLVDRVSADVAGLARRDGVISLNQYADWFNFSGVGYPVVQQTWGTVDEESIASAPVHAITSSSPVFALVLARLQAFSQARFQWTRFEGSQPTDLFGTPELAVLERPWRGGTTSDLLARMELHVSGAGQAYVTRPARDRLAVLRPDRMTIVMGSQTDAEDPVEAPDVEIIGWVHTTSRGKVTVFGPNDVAHFAPYPDPNSVFLGMSWITAALREMQADSLAIEHKARFFQNAATPNLAIKFDPSVTRDQVLAFKAIMDAEHRGVWNAYKTLFLGGGADPVVIGKDFQQLDFATIQSKGESRLAANAGVPPSWVGFSEGLQGSSLNAGNFNSARRRFSDGTMHHLWTNAASSLEVLLTKPDPGASLWHDSRVPFMREDAQDVAAIQQQQANTIAMLVKDGFTPESVVAAVKKNDFGLLVHTGLTSVQLQPPMTEQPTPAPVSNGMPMPGMNGKALGVGG